jgi:hypothetical protein
MPAGKGLRSHNGSRLTPVEAATEADQSETSGIVRTSGFHVALLIHRQLLTQEEVFCCKSRGRTQTEPEEPHHIGGQREQRGSEQYEVTAQTQQRCHWQCTLRE